MNGGQFYLDHTSELLIDTQLPNPPPPQNILLDSLRRCNDLVQRDMRYAHLVAGASKMPMSMIWTSRNQDELVNDVDLAKLKDISWNEFIQKRYLPAITSGQSPGCTALSMLEIVREMNLQRRRFQIMGLHEQVEASEIQLVLHLCQARILHPTANTNGEYRSLANRFRRHDRFYEAFALAVGAFVCSSAPFTLGAATTRYERDLQYEYKKHTTALFVYVLQQYPGAVNEAGVYDEDYVLRISRLIVVWPSAGGCGGDGGAHDGGGLPPSFPEVPPQQKSSVTNESLLGAAVAAQTMAEKAEYAVGKVEKALRAEVVACKSELRHSVGLLNDSMQKETQDRENALHEERQERMRLDHRIAEHVDQLLIGWLSAGRPGGDGVGNGLKGMFDTLKDGLQDYVNGKVQDVMGSDMNIISNTRDLILNTANEIRLLGVGLNTRLTESDIQRTVEIQRVKSEMEQRIAASNQRMDAAMVTVGSEIQKLYVILGTIGGGAAAPSPAVDGVGVDLQDVKTKVASWAHGVDATLGELRDVSLRIDKRVSAANVAIEEMSADINRHNGELKTLKHDILNEQIQDLIERVGALEHALSIEAVDKEQIIVEISEIREMTDHLIKDYNEFRENEEQMIQKRNESMNDFIFEYCEPIVREMVADEINKRPPTSTGESHSKRPRADTFDAGGHQAERGPGEPFIDLSADPGFIESIASKVSENKKFEEYIASIIQKAIAESATPFPHPPADVPAAAAGGGDGGGDIAHRLAMLERAMRRMEGVQEPGYDEVAGRRLDQIVFNPPPP
jgi:hypothetical protein